MKIQVRVDDQLYEVAVGDLHTRPIVATVAGEVYEVWPEEPTVEPGRGSPPPAPPDPVVPRSLTASPPAATLPVPPAADLPGLHALRAPLPGVVVAVTVQPGQQIAAGQELCVLEAMKMLNTIRASRAGQVAAVHIAVGQHVQHNDLLIEYAD
jgi:biotin carboxyl carrier protein